MALAIPQRHRGHREKISVIFVWEGGSRHKNMKELRFYADDGVWRIAFAFDPKKKAILLVAGNKAGTSEKRFYKIPKPLTTITNPDQLGC